MAYDTVIVSLVGTYIIIKESTWFDKGGGVLWILTLWNCNTLIKDEAGWRPQIPRKHSVIGVEKNVIRHCHIIIYRYMYSKRFSKNGGVTSRASILWAVWPLKNITWSYPTEPTNCVNLWIVLWIGDDVTLYDSV
jgi:hypothetical protein